MGTRKAKGVPAGATRSPISLFHGGGEMGRRLAEVDWRQHPLGEPAQWPQGLQTAVRIMLTSRYPMFIWWREELYNLYNDAYIPVLGQRHPAALARPARDSWREIWADVGPLAARVMREGEAVWAEQHLLMMERHGYREETYFTFCYSPAPDDAGGVGGVLCTCTEETQRVVETRRMNLLRELGADLAAAKTEPELLHALRHQLGRHPADVPVALLYLFDAAGSAAHLACVHGLDAEHPWATPRLDLSRQDERWPATDLRAARAPVTLDTLGLEDAPLARGTVDQAVLVPIARPGHEDAIGFIVVGLNPFRPLDEAYRGFLELLGRQVAAALANVRALDEEHRRAEALAELDHAKTAFFSNVSHEFRTPLTLLLGPLEGLLRESDEVLPPPTRESLELSARNGRRLLKLVNTLLDFSRIEAGRARPQPVATDLAALTREIAAVFRSTIEQAGLRLRVEAASARDFAYVDREMWETIVFNLLSNAYKFTWEGEITVRVGQEEGLHVLQVSDTGTGIPPEEVPHLFTRFHRIRGANGRTHEGTGIGLALVQELARLHRGTVSVESEPGRGTTFRVSIPAGPIALPAGPEETSRAPVALPAPVPAERVKEWVAETRSPATDEASSPEPDPDPDVLPARRRILLADDNADMRAYIRRLLAADYRVEAVPDGEAALQAVRRQRPDLLLADVMMPRRDGISLLEEIRRDPNLQGLPVILLSARAGEEASTEGYEAHADDYLTKPFSARELRARVAAHLNLAEVRQRERLLSLAAAVQARHRQFQSELAEQVSLLQDDREIIRCATRLLGEHLGAQRCYFIEAPEEGRAAVRVADDWSSSDQVLRLAGQYDIRDFGPRDWWDAVSTAPLLVNDVERHELTAAAGPSYAALNVRSYCTAPFIRGGRWVVSLSVTADHPRTWAAEEIALLQNVVARVWPLVERARTEQAMRTSERQLHETLALMPAGVYTCDAAGRITYFNAAAEELWGRRPELGREQWCGAARLSRPDGSRLAPEEGPMALALRQQQSRRAEPVVVERADGTRRHVLAYPQAIRGPRGELMGGVNMLVDVTEQRERDRNAALLAHLTQRLALLADEREIIRTSTELVGQHLGARRCYFVEPADASAASLRVVADWRADEAPSLAGLHQRAAFGNEAWWEAYTTRRFAVADVSADVLTRDQPSGYEALGVRAFATAPFVREGRWAAVLAVTHHQPRVWTDEELALLADVVARVWPLVERARAQAVLQESEERFRNMADTSPVMLWIADQDGRYVYVNRSWQEFTGQHLADAFGEGRDEAIHPEDRDAVREAMETARRDRLPLRMEYRLRRADGEFRWAIDAAAPRLGANGDFLGHVGSILDITERKQAELSARAHADRLQLALAASNSGDWSWDAATDVMTLSPRAAAIFGVAPGPVITWTAMRGLLDEQDAERARRAVEQALAANTDYDIEFRIVRPAGVSWVAARGRGIYAPGGEVRGMLGVLQEINGRKRAEQALRDREQRLERLIALMPAGIYTCDAEGRITFYNRRAAELWGDDAPAPEERRRYCGAWKLLLLDGTVQPPEASPMAVALRERRPVRDVERLVEHPNGSRWVVSLNIDLLSGPEDQLSGAIGVILDVTERKRAENLVASQNRALQLMATSAPLPEILGELVQTLERESPGAIGSILLVDADGQHLRHGAAPSLSEDFVRAVDGIPIAWDLATCPAAVARKTVVVTPDVERDPGWASCREVLRPFGLRAVWSLPILGSDGTALGTFATYYREARGPTDRERETVAALAKAAAIAIERRRHEDAVRAAEAQLRLVTDSSPVMLTQFNAQRRVTFANRAYLERRGVTWAEMAGQTIEEVVGRETYEQIRPYVDLVLAGVRVDYELEVEFPRIGLRTITVSYVPDRDVNGQVRGWVSAISDITESRRADAATRQLAAIVESSEDAIISKDLAGRITSWNKGAERIFGFDAAEVLGQPVSLILPEEGAEEEVRIIERMRRGERVQHSETQRRRKDGTVFDVSLSISPIRDAQGRTIGVSTVARDITERKRQEAELRRREQLYRGVGESINYGIWVSDAVGQHTYASESFLRLLGYTPAQAAGLGWADALHPDEREATLAAWQACVRTGDFWEREQTFRGADGAWHPVLTRGVPIRDEQGNITSWAGLNLDISAFRQAQEAVRQGEERFRAMADNIAQLAWMADPDGRIVWVNQRWIDYTGLTVEQFDEEAQRRVVHPDHFERVGARFRRQFADGEIWEDTFPLRGQAGGFRWFLSRAVPIRDEQGAILRWFGTNTDITDLRAAQDILRQRTRTLETLNRVGNALVAELDLERIVATVTDAGREISGAAFGAFRYNDLAQRGQPLSLEGPPREAFERFGMPHNQVLLEQTFRGNGIVRVDDLQADRRLAHDAVEAGTGALPAVRSFLGVPVISRSGEVLGGLFFGHPAPGVFNQGAADVLTGLAAQAAIAIDNAMLYAALQRELEQQKRVDAALRASERQLRLVTDYAPVFLVLVDRECRYKFINRPYAERHGREPRDALGLHIAEVIGQAAFESFRHHLDRAFAGHRVDYEMEIPYDELGPRWMHAVYVPEQTPEGEVTGVLAVMSDITGRKQVEREIEIARDRALAASRAKDDFLAALSHELRTPLNPVLLLASDAAEDPSLSPEVREAFATIRNNVELEARLIDDLLDLTRIARGKLPLDLRVHDAHGILQAALTTVQRDIEEKGVELTVDLRAEASEVWGDAVRLQQIFWNVLKNAVKFTPAGGQIRVESRVVPTDRLEVQVTDTGIGLTASELARVFDAFAQGDHAGSGGSHLFGGVGLGLSISQMLVEQHGGRIRAESAGRDCGATFRIELPLARARMSSLPARRLEQREAVADAARGDPADRDRPEARVLLVEDHEPTRSTLAQLLVRRHYTVSCAGTLAEARALAREGEYDLLISDLGLPDGSGYELMTELRARRPIRGIALSGYGMEEDLARSQRAGFAQHLTKPVRVQSLDRALAEVRG